MKNMFLFSAAILLSAQIAFACGGYKEAKLDLDTDKSETYSAYKQESWADTQKSQMNRANEVHGRDTYNWMSHQERAITDYGSSPNARR